MPDLTRFPRRKPWNRGRSRRPLQRPDPEPGSRRRSRRRPSLHTRTWISPRARSPSRKPLSPFATSSSDRSTARRSACSRSCRGDMDPNGSNRRAGGCRRGERGALAAAAHAGIGRQGRLGRGFERRFHAARRRLGLRRARSRHGPGIRASRQGTAVAPREPRSRDPRRARLANERCPTTPGPPHGAPVSLRTDQHTDQRSGRPCRSARK